MSEIKLSEIKIGKRFRTKLGDISRLKESIEEVGLLHPIVVSEKKELIAGFRRIEAFKELGKDSIPIHVVNLKDIAKGEIHENMVRKDFTVSEMVAIKRHIEPEMIKEAEERKKAGKPSSKLDAGRTDEKIAKYLGVGKDTLRKAEALVVASEKAPEKFKAILEKVDTGKQSVDKVFQEVKGWEKLENATPTKFPETIEITIKNADFRLNDLERNSVDLIVTDPIWEKAEDWQDLGIYGNKLLKEGAYLVAFSGTFYLDKAIIGISKSLTYESLLCLELTGGWRKYLDWKVAIQPIIVYYKGMRKGHDWLENIIRSSPSKGKPTYHNWAKNLGVVKSIIERFSKPNELVWEPFAGGGSTIQACIETKRNCIAYEINPETFQILKKRFPDAKFN